MADDAAQAKKRVWLLGAGFSRSLGGPLMNDLLSIPAWRQVLALYSDQIEKKDADLVFWLYHYGSGFPEGTLDPEMSGRGERRWRDAEQFLEFLDRACSGDQVAAGAVKESYEGLSKRISGPPQVKETLSPGAFARKDMPGFDELSKMTKRMVAASCCGFLDGVTPENAREDKERWIPYKSWLACLNADDSILTFNYDLVVEMLQPQVGNGIKAVHIASGDDDSIARAMRLPLLYKLHGSVNWNIQHGRIIRPGRNDSPWTPGMLLSAFDIAIATPGDSKMKMAGGLFGNLWDRAAGSLCEADEVYIIGFRFPPSDAYPRSHLLNALKANKKKHLRVHVILGPDRSSDQGRVLALLQWTLGVPAVFDPVTYTAGRGLYAHSQYAEDFLEVWEQANRGW